MTLLGYVLVAVSAILVANAIPHLTRGSVGRRHRVPWRVSGSAAENVLWASSNLLIGIWLASWAATFALSLPVALSVGVISGGAYLTWLGSQFARTD